MQAYDLLSMMPQKPATRKHQPVATFARATFCGLIRYTQWMRAAEVSLQLSIAACYSRRSSFEWETKLPPVHAW